MLLHTAPDYDGEDNCREHHRHSSWASGYDWIDRSRDLHPNIRANPALSGPTHNPNAFYWMLAIYACICLVAFVVVVAASVRQVTSGASWLIIPPYGCPLLAVPLVTVVAPATLGFSHGIAFGLALLPQPLVCLICSLSLHLRRRRTVADTVSIWIGYLYIAAGAVSLAVGLSLHPGGALRQRL